MDLELFMNRIRINRLRVAVIAAILLFPILEIIYYFWDILKMGGSVLKPDYAFFLACNTVGIGHFFQAVFLWLMPLYCLFLCADDCIEDYITGYKNMLISRLGRKKYVDMHLRKSYILTFCIISCSLLLNLLLVHIVFYGGQHSPYSDELVTSHFYQWEADNPFLANLLFIFMTAFISGLISMVGTMAGIVLHNKKMAYGITMLLWGIPFLQKKSLMLLFQPHSEYVLDTLVPLALEVILLYVAFILLGYCKEVYFEKKNA